MDFYDTTPLNTLKGGLIIVSGVQYLIKLQLLGQNPKILYYDAQIKRVRMLEALYLYMKLPTQVCSDPRAWTLTPSSLKILLHFKNTQRLSRVSNALTSSKNES